jgi:hypothetical protein
MSENMSGPPSERAGGGDTPEFDKIDIEDDAGTLSGGRLRAAVQRKTDNKWLFTAWMDFLGPHSFPAADFNNLESVTGEPLGSGTLDGSSVSTWRLEYQVPAGSQTQTLVGAGAGALVRMTFNTHLGLTSPYNVAQWWGPSPACPEPHMAVTLGCVCIDFAGTGFEGWDILVTGHRADPSEEEMHLGAAVPQGMIFAENGLDVPNVTSLDVVVSKPGEEPETKSVVAPAGQVLETVIGNWGDLENAGKSIAYMGLT